MTLPFGCHCEQSEAIPKKRRKTSSWRSAKPGGPPIHAAKSLIAIALCLAATLAQAAGFRFIAVPWDADDPALTGAIWYPCADPPGEIHLGPLTLPGVRDRPISGDMLPLVVMSHGDGGQFWGSHDTVIRPRRWP
jgi:hypothetical protein